ncbi:hypothetical protein CSUB01_08016 [Colletotrichum sublineola]|uniref:Myb/SANT-like domain-containing protein n=1 Tax=Colletotrichum sublineola TaxID=1173701 RepID=A0A066X1V3_COLSU|nr:hypothetical protein CSUB01_08016 [Colletotrichum sublineola]
MASMALPTVFKRAIGFMGNKWDTKWGAGRILKTLIRSGVGYDNNTGIITTSEESWQTFEERFPYLKSIRSKGFPYMDEMGELWPEEVATGRYIVEVDEANNQQEVDEEDEAEEEQQSAVGNRRKRREEFDPDVNPLSSSPPMSESLGDSLQLARRKMTRAGRERHDTLTSFGHTLERGLGGLSEAMVALATPQPAVTATAQREPGSDDISRAIDDYQQLFEGKLDNRVAAKVALYFAKSAHTAVAWLAIKSVDSKEEFLREAGIIE